MTDTVISVENLWKQYRYGTITHATLRKDFQSWWARVRGKEDPNLCIDEEIQTFDSTGNSDSTSASDRFWALKDVSFEVKQGEVLGIIGRNGAGKSTLLKIMSKVTTPTKGQIKLKGRVASLLEVGTGFHPELTGRENIFLNGAILGMTKPEIRRKFDEIVAFAEVEKFIETPVKRYSSGMYVRLAFAVAAHLDPEILIVDEVLAVGDSQFQKKCLGKMGDVAKEGRTILFVSHNMGAVRALCSRAIILDGGMLTVDAPAYNSVRTYLTDVGAQASTALQDRGDRQGNGNIRFTEFWLESLNGERMPCALLGDPVRFCLAYEACGEMEDVYVAFDLQEQFGEPLINCNTDEVGSDFPSIPARGVFRCELPRFPLRGGRYVGNVYCAARDEVCDWIQAAIRVDVEDGDYFGAAKRKNDSRLVVEQQWSICRQNTAIGGSGGGCG